jgi:glutaredoxin
MQSLFILILRTEFNFSTRIHPINRTMKANSEPISIVVYTRIGCHLCEEAERFLHTRCTSLGMGVRTIDVDSDPELAAEFGESVPVVTVNGKVRFRGCVSPVLLDRLLRMEAASRR